MLRLQVKISLFLQVSFFDIENGTFRVVAIDGFRLAIRTETIECQDNYHFVVPKKLFLRFQVLSRRIQAIKPAVSIQIISISFLK